MVVPTLFAFDYPSFQGFPWMGIIVCVGLWATAAMCVAASRWVETQSSDLSIPGGERWAVVYAVLAAAIAVGVVIAGPLAVPPAALAVGAVTFVFARQRDRLVPAGKKAISSAGFRSAATSLVKLPKRKAGAGPVVEKAAKPVAQSDLVKKVMALLQNLSRPVKNGKNPAVADGPGAEDEPDVPFTFMKKDGTPAIEGGDRSMSENVVQARRMLVAAMRAGATDLHFEPHDQNYVARLRVDGVLRDGRQISRDMGRSVISAIKVVADMDIAERRRPQDGTFSAVFGTDKYDIRVASTPTSYGEKLVLRLLQSSGGVMKSGLDSIGLRPGILKQLREVIHKPYGMFIVAGPTGSGKTTTVYASLSEIDAHQHNITTIEDPVEYRLDNITQIAVNSKAGVSFASILRSVLRQDPDVLLVGEIRDKETAEIACQAALTGHFVFSTLHANDTVSTVTRLLDLGLEPTLIQTALTAVLGQRLARRLCPKCKEPCSPPDGLVKKFVMKDGPVKRIYRERGCEHCGGTGYRGRMGIHELLVLDDPFRKLITGQPNINDLSVAAKKSGTITLKNDGLIKVLKGDTSLNEILRVTT